MSQAALAALREALARAAGHLPRLAAPAPPARFDPRRVRAIRITGAGSSAAHARFLAALLAEELGLPARFVPLDSFPCAADSRDALVVFSQALSPNAELALTDPGGWRAAVLVTAAAASRDAERRERVLAFARAGGEVVASAGAEEFGTLLRVEGPIAGFVAALRLARSLGLPATPDLARVPEAFAAALRHGEALAREHAARLAETQLLGLASGADREAAEHVRVKLVEGLQRPVGPLADPIEFAHGPFQALAARPATLLALTRPDAPHEADRLRRLGALLTPGRHLLVTLPATLPGFLAILEHEALATTLVLAAMGHAGIDPSCWPGKDVDAPLYSLRAPPFKARAWAPPEGALAALTWPEVERGLAEGRRLAVLPLGATEQHGPHLPFATDTWIADALAERLVAQLPHAVRLPTLALGASREHIGFPGTLSLREATLAAVLEDLVRSLARHGFAEIFCFSAHGGNLATLRAHEGSLAEAARPARWLALTEHGAIEARLRSLAAAHGVTPAAAGHHAGEIEASIVAALRPGALRVDALAPGLLETPADVQQVFYPDLRANAPSGVVGDPRPASPDRADAYLAAWASELVLAYEGAKKRHQT